MSAATPSTPSVSSVTEQLASTTVSDDKTDKTSTDKEDPEEEEVAPVSFVTGLHPEDNEAKVTVNNSDIYNAAKSFDELGLRKEILTAIYEMKFNNPSKIQAAALPIVLSKDRPNLIGQAHHGSGKTAAFSLCVLSQIDETKAYPQAVIVAPVRELAIQISDVINNLAKYTQIKVATLIKSADTSGKITQQVIVGTPGSILGAMQYKRLDTRSIKVFVADEADHMVDKGEGMGEQTLRIKNSLPPRMQILLFSATFSDRVKKFAERIAPKAVEIFVKREDLSLDKIAQYYIECKDEGDKFTQLAGILSVSVSGQCIIFVRTVATAKLLANRMREEGFAVSLLHGQDMDVKERDKVMADFRENRTTILITTNVLSRGIDVLTVTLVINFDIPVNKFGKADFETYIHRIGRSGRFGRKGVAINFVITGGKCMENLGRIAQFFGKNIIQLPNEPEVIAEKIKQSLK